MRKAFGLMCNWKNMLFDHYSELENRIPFFAKKP